MSKLFFQRRKIQKELKKSSIAQLIDPGVKGFNKMATDIGRLSISSLSTHCGDDSGDDHKPVGDRLDLLDKTMELNAEDTGINKFKKFIGEYKGRMSYQTKLNFQSKRISKLPSPRKRIYYANHLPAYKQMAEEMKQYEDPRIYDKPPKKMEEVDWTKYSERAR